MWEKQSEPFLTAVWPPRFLNNSFRKAGSSKNEVVKLPFPLPSAAVCLLNDPRRASTMIVWVSGRGGI
jgi:hypothetical protein